MYVCIYILPPCFPLSLHRCSGAYSHQLLQVVKLNLRNYTYQFTFRSLYAINSFRYFSKMFFTPPIRGFFFGGGGVNSFYTRHARTRSYKKCRKSLQVPTCPYMALHPFSAPNRIVTYTHGTNIPSSVSP